jgi:hypothetical protein
MEFHGRKTFRIGVGSLAVLVSGLTFIAGVSSATAATCVAGGSKTSTSTTASYYSGTCRYVQARIDRYEPGSSVLSYYGPANATYSYVSSGLGYDNGHAIRNMPSTTWTSWAYF